MKNLLHKINVWGHISNLMYAKRVIREIYDQKVLYDHYYLTDKNGDFMDNPLLVGDKLVLELPLPNDIKDVDIEQYGVDHSKLLFNTLLKVDLYGVVNIDKRVIMNKDYNAEDASSDYGAIIFVVKPDYSRLLTSIAWIVAILLLIINIFYYFKR